MAIEFQRRVFGARFLDPSQDFRESSISVEIRFDPLTGQGSFVYGMGYPDLKRLDLAEVMEKPSNCPFCPVNLEKVTAKFPPELVPEGRIYLGEACVFPNIRPYAQYGAVVVLSREHFVDLENFTGEMLTDGFLAGQTYCHRVLAYDPEARYCSVGWNYMPPSGGTQVHPHFQVSMDPLPAPFQGELLEASRRYQGENGGNFWDDLITEERRWEERYIGTTGRTCWIAAFAPRGRVGDVMAIFQGANSFFDLSPGDLRDFSEGLRRVFRYFKDHHFHSFNLSVYSGTGKEDYFWCHARLVPRFTYAPLGVSDRSYLEVLEGQLFSRMSPEQVCQDLKPYF